MIGATMILAVAASETAPPVVHESTGTWKECVWKSDEETARKMAEQSYRGRFSIPACPLDWEIEIPANRPKLIRIMADMVATRDRQRRDAALANCLVVDAKARQGLVALFANPTAAEASAAREKLKQDKFETTEINIARAVVMQRSTPPGIIAAANRCDAETWVSWNKWGRGALVQWLAPLLARAKAGGV